MTSRRRKAIAGAGVLGALVLGTQQVATQCAPAPESAYLYVGGAEFDDGTLGPFKPLNLSTYGDGNNEKACLMARNVTQTGETVKITAKPEAGVCGGEPYTSGFLSSRDAGRYFPRFGIFEMRAKIPHAQGLWPAFWLRHRNGAGRAEVDVMEYFHSQVPGKITQTLHLDGRLNLSKRTTYVEAPSLAPEWRTYRVDILPVEGTDDVRFTFYVDGKVTHIYTDTQADWSRSVDPEATWDIAVNLAVAGRWVGDPDGTLGYLPDLSRCAQSGTPPDQCSTSGIRRVDWSASTFEVDYVRMLKPNPDYQGETP